ncbi:MAG: hypothetical protein M3Y54_10340 [Bacteroidota bacterium]|nr:hypothetical protein [Bacteroidota bacterium]
MRNEWDLLVAARRSTDAGEAQLCFTVLSPPRWTIFSGRPARVQAPDGTAYELGADFPTVLHELIRGHIDTELEWSRSPPRYELSFRPGRYHPRFDPARPDGRGEYYLPGLPVSPGSHQALRSLLDALPPPEEPAPAPGDGDDSP